MAIYRDPDDAPVDPILDDEPRALREPRGAAPARPRAVDPDALRPAHLGDDDAPIEPDDELAVTRFG